MKHIFRGKLVAPALHMSEQASRMALAAGPDYPAGDLLVQVRDHELVGVFDTPGGRLKDVAYTTLCNIVQDIAGAMCRETALVEGTWVYPIIMTVETEDRSFSATYSPISVPFRDALARNGITPEVLSSIVQTLPGSHLRNAMDNINLALMEPKFARVNFFTALEALRVSIAELTGGRRKKEAEWELFRTTLQVSWDQINSVEDQALRHGDYASASPLSGAQLDAAKLLMAEVISKYVGWFKRNQSLAA